MCIREALVSVDMIFVWQNKRTCTRVGLSASLSSTIIAPAMHKSSHVMGLGGSSFDIPTTMRPILSRASFISLHSASTAISSDATDMSYCVSRVCPFSVGDWPTVILRKKRSLMSTTRFQFSFVMSKLSREKSRICSAVSALGSMSVGMFKLARRLFCAVENSRFPFLLGTRRVKSAWSDCVAS